MAKTVAVILLNWNTPLHTANCITSLQKHCDSDGFDIIVADNGSTDNSLTQLMLQFPDLIFIDNKENLGFAEGNNRALQYSISNGYKYSLLLNTDTIVDQDIVTRLSNHLNLHNNAAAVQPAIYWLHDKTRIWNGKGTFDKILGITRTDTTVPVKNAKHEQADWLTGCCMLIRNAVLLKSGLFNKRFFLYYEDVELSYRMRKQAYELHYLPSTKMYHEAGVSAKVEKEEGFLSPVIHYYITRNRIWFLRGYGNALLYPLYIFTSVFYYTALWLYFKLRRRNAKAAFLVKGFKEGLFAPKSLIWPHNSEQA